MRAVLTAVLLAAALPAGFAASAGVKPGLYECRTPSGTETSATFTIGPNGTYGDPDGDVAGLVRGIGSSELKFSGGDKDGSRALVINDTRVKVGKRIFCEWQKPKPQPTPAVEAATEQPAPDRPKPKLIVVKPELRR